MWQYTTETIINSNKGKLPAIDSKGATVVADPVDPTKAAKVKFYVADNTFYIEGVGAFKAANVKNAWHRPYQPAIPAKAELTIPAITKDEYYRLQVWVSEEGTIRPELQNAMMMKSLPFQFEVKATNDAVQLAADFADAVKKMFLKKGADRLFTVADNSNMLEFVATDCYVRFDEIRIDRIEDSKNLTGYQDYEELIVLDKETLGKTPNIRGTEGNGTVARLVKNLRIPTKVSLDPFGADHGGKPVPGGKYDQFMFEYITDRSHVGHQVFGSVGDQSLTTHVFFVEEGIANDFAAELAKVADTVETYSPSVTATGEYSPAPVAKVEGKGAKK
jgi:hypothetical protein